jgi:hypothetical protein
MKDFRKAHAQLRRWFFLGGLLFPAAIAHAQAPGLLPDAPQPAIAAALPLSRIGQASAPAQPKTRHLAWRPYVDPGQPFQPLSARQKMTFWLHLETQPWSPLPAFVSAAFGQGVNGDPKFGTDSGAFGERLGAAFVRQASMRFFVSSLFPVLLREDPRYFRVAHGRIVVRGLRAGEQALVTRTDNGRTAPNYSDLLGHLAACALTVYYYPAPSANGRVVAEAWVTSIGGDALNNLLLEFIPSVIHHFQRHRPRVRSVQSLRSSSIS